MSIIRDKTLAAAGLAKINWVKDFMPVLNHFEKKLAKEQPLKGMKVTVCVHLEAKTAYLGLVLRAAGAEITVTGSNPLSTKDDVCAALDSLGVEVYAWHGATAQEYHDHQVKSLEFCPDIIIDDGSDLVTLLHDEVPEYAKNLLGGCEETTTGVSRLRVRSDAGKLKFPMFAVNDAKCKYLFDNHHGTGQTSWEAIMYSTNNMVSGRTVVVAGYGHCGSGIASRAKGLGANVIVTEVDRFKALRALMDGFRVMPMMEAVKLGDIFVTATGCTKVITTEHFKMMKNKVLLSNAGHFDVEVDRAALEAMAVKKENRKLFIDGYHLSDGKVLNLLAEGRLVNIVAGNGHPADIMDMSFGIQLLGVLHVAKNARGLKPMLYNIPQEIDEEVIHIKLDAMGVSIDALTPEQEKYLGSM
ncbi:MAG: adenosylhomocysteinase [Treponema sp.]|jgi:adenosylhomocysteinase|nr:adenosylhomocysteinase [Treponema sp.]